MMEYLFRWYCIRGEPQRRGETPVERSGYFKHFSRATKNRFQLFRRIVSEIWYYEKCINRTGINHTGTSVSTGDGQDRIL